MSLADDHGPDEGGDEIVAAEYVVGVLPDAERQGAARRIDGEPAFARLVDRWEVHLSPLASAYEAVEAPAWVKPAIDRRLFGPAPGVPAPYASGLWASLAFWRGLAVASLAAFAIYAAYPHFVAPPPDMRLVASLVPNQSDVRYLALYDPASNQVSLSHVSGERAVGRDFELWMIEGKDKPPVSMGVVPVGSTIHLVLSPAIRQKLASGATLAISLEPAGGSPTGSPTGPVVAAGDLKKI